MSTQALSDSFLNNIRCNVSPAGIRGTGDSLEKTNFDRDKNMKYIVCTAFVLLLFLNGTQAEENYVIELKGLSGSLSTAPFSPDEKKMVMANSNGTICIWDAESGEALKKLGNNGFAVAYSPDGKKIAMACGDGCSEIWDVESGKMQTKLLQHWGAIKSIAYAPDGKPNSPKGLQTIQHRKYGE